MPSSQRLDATTSDIDMHAIRADRSVHRRQRSSKRKNAAGMLESSATLPVSLMLSSRRSKRQLSERSLLELQHCNSASPEHKEDDELILATTRQQPTRPSTLAPEPGPSTQGVPCRTVLCDMRDRVPASPSDKQSRIMDLRKATLLRAMQHKQEPPTRRPLAPTTVPSPSQQLDPICCSAAVGLGLCAMECASDCESDVSDMQMRDDCLFAMSDDEVGSVYVVGPRRAQRSAMAVAA